MTAMTCTCRVCGVQWTAACTGWDFLDALIQRSSSCDTCLAATCARCGVVFRDGREHGLIERQEFDPELGQLFIAHFCPACDAVREAA